MSSVKLKLDFLVVTPGSVIRELFLKKSCDYHVTGPSDTGSPSDCQQEPTGRQQNPPSCEEMGGA